MDVLVGDIKSAMELIEDPKVKRFCAGVIFGLQRELFNPDAFALLYTTEDLFSLLHDYGCMWDGEADFIGPVRFLNEGRFTVRFEVEETNTWEL